MTNERQTEKLQRFGPGPWVTEPDRVEWTSHGFPCLITRGPLGTLCGYVAVPPGHPLHGDGGAELDVHGGITYADTCHGEICHVPADGESADVWWFGFDCAHASVDLIPQLQHELSSLTSSMIYRDVDYVRAECERLAAQLARKQMTPLAEPPAHLAPAYRWTDAAGELAELARLRDGPLATYASDSASNAREHGVHDVSESDLLDLAEWLRGRAP